MVNLETLGDFNLLSLLGVGGYGKVFKALHMKKGVVVALKLVPNVGGKELNSVKREVKLLTALRHSKIVAFYGDISTKEYYGIVQEYMDTGSLSDIVGRYGTVPERLLRRFMVQIISGLRYLHSQGVIHRDIKGGNVLMNKDGEVKLADFGISVGGTPSVSSGGMKAKGSPYWMAPELLEGSSASSAASDVWALGITILEMINGKPPHAELPVHAALFHIMTKPVPAEERKTCSKLLNGFLDRCLQKDPRQRATAAELLDDPWITELRDEVDAAEWSQLVGEMDGSTYWAASMSNLLAFSSSSGHSPVFSIQRHQTFGGAYTERTVPHVRRARDQSQSPAIEGSMDGERISRQRWKRLRVVRLVSFHAHTQSNPQKQADRVCSALETMAQLYVAKVDELEALSSMDLDGLLTAEDMEELRMLEEDSDFMQEVELGAQVKEEQPNPAAMLGAELAQLKLEEAKSHFPGSGEGDIQSFVEKTTGLKKGGKSEERTTMPTLLRGGHESSIVVENDSVTIESLALHVATVMKHSLWMREHLSERGVAALLVRLLAHTVRLRTFQLWMSPCSSKNKGEDEGLIPHVVHLMRVVMSLLNAITRNCFPAQLSVCTLWLFKPLNTATHKVCTRLMQLVQEKSTCDDDEEDMIMTGGSSCRKKLANPCTEFLGECMRMFEQFVDVEEESIRFAFLTNGSIMSAIASILHASVLMAHVSIQNGDTRFLWMSKLSTAVHTMHKIVAVVRQEPLLHGVLVSLGHGQILGSLALVPLVLKPMRMHPHARKLIRLAVETTTWFADQRCPAESLWQMADVLPLLGCEISMMIDAMQKVFGDERSLPPLALLMSELSSIEWDSALQVSVLDPEKEEPVVQVLKCLLLVSKKRHVRGMVRRFPTIVTALCEWANKEEKHVFEAVEVCICILYNLCAACPELLRVALDANVVHLLRRWFKGSASLYTTKSTSRFWGQVPGVSLYCAVLKETPRLMSMESVHRDLWWMLGPGQAVVPALNVLNNLMRKSEGEVQLWVEAFLIRPETGSNVLKIVSDGLDDMLTLEALAALIAECSKRVVAGLCLTMFEVQQGFGKKEMVLYQLMKYFDEAGLSQPALGVDSAAAVAVLRIVTCIVETGACSMMEMSKVVSWADSVRGDHPSVICRSMAERLIASEEPRELQSIPRVSVESSKEIRDQ